MRRALGLLLLVLTLFVPHAAEAQLNFKDQKSVDAEIKRRVDEAMKPYADQINRDTKAGQAMSGRLNGEMQKTTPAEASKFNPSAAPIFECKRGGCNGELCLPGLETIGNAFASACMRMEFYSCYASANCVKVKDPSGKIDMCRWDPTPELRSCLSTKGGQTALNHAGITQ